MKDQKFKKGDIVREKTKPELKLFVKEYELDYRGLVLERLMGANVETTPKPTLMVICTFTDSVTGNEKTKKRHQDNLEFWN